MTVMTMMIMMLMLMMMMLRGSAASGVSLLNPATGRDRAAGPSPLGLTFRYKAARPMPPTMRRTCAEHAHTFYAGPSLIRGEGFADWFRRLPSIFVASPRSAQNRVQKRAFLGGAYYWTTPPALPASSWMMRMMLCMLAMRVMLGMLSPKPCNLKILKSKVDGKWMEHGVENGWNMAWIEISKS